MLMEHNTDLGIDVSKARFWSNAMMTVEVPMPEKGEVERILGYVPIVRCGACKYAETSDDPDIGLWCARYGRVFARDFFCRDGERRDDADT